MNRPRGISRRELLRLFGAAGASALLPRCAGSKSGVAPISAASGPVIVVGAGMAGLTFANALRNAGVDTLILEARDRIGGRLWTRDLQGIPIDMGGSWIHNPNNNPMSAFADRAGVQRTSVDPTDDLATIFAYDEQTGPVLTPEIVHAFAAYEGFEETASTWLRQTGDQASVKDGIEAYFGDVGLAMTPDQRRRALHVTRYIHEAFDAARWDDISLYYTVNSPIVNYGGSEFGDFPVGGYTRLVEAMAGRSQVRLRHRVTRIAYTADAVTVEADVDGTPATFEASHVLVTLPLGVLKSGDVAFDPPLPEGKLGAIARVGYGDFEKIALRFDRPFWEDGGRTHFYFVSGDAEFPLEYPFFLDYQRAVGAPALAGLFTADFAAKFLSQSQAQNVERVQEILREAYGSNVPAPTSVLTSSWGLDPFSRGSYSYLAVGSTPQDMDTLAEPLGERVMFAGEATYPQRYGYADGALSSGLREARRLLGTDQVTVTPGG